jgi:hypothetical protein
MSVTYIAALLEEATAHPLIAVAITLFVSATVVLGLMHQTEVAGEILILLVKLVKNRVRVLLLIGIRLKAQFSTWDDPEEVDDPASSVKSVAVCHRATAPRKDSFRSS